MYCTRCGASLQDGTKYCGSCGTGVERLAPSRLHGGQRPWNESALLRRQSVILTVFLYAITVNIYLPCWFLSRRDAINSLRADEKVGVGPLMFAVVVLSSAFLISGASGFFRGLGNLDTSQFLDLVASLLLGSAIIIIEVQSFKLRRIFEVHLRSVRHPQAVLSGAAVFFFHIFYLQYVINRRLAPEGVADTT